MTAFDKIRQLSILEKEELEIKIKLSKQTDDLISALKNYAFILKKGGANGI
jgi:hypothetical protein